MNKHKNYTRLRKKLKLKIVFLKKHPESNLSKTTLELQRFEM